MFRSFGQLRYVRRNSRLRFTTTAAAHMPAAHRAHMEWTPTRLIHWGQSTGPAAAEAVTRPMAENKHPEHGYRACLGLLSLAKRYGKDGSVTFPSPTPSWTASCRATIDLPRPATRCAPNDLKPAKRR